MSKNPAAPLLRRAADLLQEQARTIAANHSLGGVGIVFRDRQHGATCRELRALANQLRLLSAAFGRSTLATGHGVPKLKAPRR